MSTKYILSICFAICVLNPICKGQYYKDEFEIQPTFFHIQDTLYARVDSLLDVINNQEFTSSQLVEAARDLSLIYWPEPLEYPDEDRLVGYIIAPADSIIFMESNNPDSWWLIEYQLSTMDFPIGPFRLGGEFPYTIIENLIDAATVKESIHNIILYDSWFKLDLSLADGTITRMLYSYTQPKPRVYTNYYDIIFLDDLGPSAIDWGRY